MNKTKRVTLEADNELAENVARVNWSLRMREKERERDERTSSGMC